jgi:hypothetical protein
MMGAQSAVSYRFMIRESVGSPGQSNDLANIVTNPLPDGAHCFVTENRSLYVFAKFSDVAPFANVVVAPNAGGGRWFLVNTTSAGVAAFAFSTQGVSNSFPASGLMAQSTTADFAASITGLWTFTASGCVLTYQGPTVRATARLVAGFTPNADPVSAYLGISHNDDLTGDAVAGVQGGAQGVNFFTQSTGEAGDFQIGSSQRLIDTLAAGDTVKPVFGQASGEATGAIASLQLIVESA